MSQRPYFKGRLIESRPEGFVVIVPEASAAPVPLGCPTCSHVMRTRDDEAAYLDYGCCDRCARLWASPRRDAWKGGWRPSPSQVVEAEASRPPIASVFDVK